ncbi:hypothetical protein [Thermococcus sp.]
MKEKRKKREGILKELHNDPLWKSIGLLDTEEEDLSERDDWGVVKWESE